MISNLKTKVMPLMVAAMMVIPTVPAFAQVSQETTSLVSPVHAAFIGNDGAAQDPGDTECFIGNDGLAQEPVDSDCSGGGEGLVSPVHR